MVAAPAGAGNGAGSTGLGAPRRGDGCEGCGMGGLGCSIGVGNEDAGKPVAGAWPQAGVTAMAVAIRPKTWACSGLGR